MPFFFYFACGSLAAPVKKEVEFRGAKGPTGFCSRSGRRDKYQAQEQGRREDFKKSEQEGASALFNIHQSVLSLLPFHCLITAAVIITCNYKTFPKAALTINAHVWRRTHTNTHQTINIGICYSPTLSVSLYCHPAQCKREQLMREHAFITHRFQTIF